MSTTTEVDVSQLQRDTDYFCDLEDVQRLRAHEQTLVETLENTLPEHLVRRVNGMHRRVMSKLQELSPKASKATVQKPTKAWRGMVSTDDAAKNAAPAGKPKVSLEVLQVLSGIHVRIRDAASNNRAPELAREMKELKNLLRSAASGEALIQRLIDMTQVALDRISEETLKIQFDRISADLDQCETLSDRIDLSRVPDAARLDQRVAAIATRLRETISRFYWEAALDRSEKLRDQLHYLRLRRDQLVDKIQTPPEKGRTSGRNSKE